MIHETVLVYGGSGFQSLAIARALVARGHTCRVLTRSAESARRIEALGAKPVYGNLVDAHSLEGATRGCDAVILTLPLVFDAGLALKWVDHVIRSAQTAGVEHFVFNTSGPVPEDETGVLAVDIKVRAKQRLAGSGLPVVGVEPALYMDNLASPWAAPSIVLHGTLAYPLPESQKVSWLSWQDMAAFVVAAMMRPDLAGQALRVGGPQALTGSQLADALSSRLKKPVSYYRVPLDDFSAGLNGALGEPVGTEIARLYGWFSGEGAACLNVDATHEETGKILSVTSQRFADWANAVDWTALTNPTP